ncbi:LORF2 protein, partial [Crocuta crocuta]
TSMFITALFTIAKVWKQFKHPLIDKWIRKMWCIYICHMCTYIPHIYVHSIYVCVCMYIHAHNVVYIYIPGHTHIEYYSTIKKNGTLPFVTTWMGLEGIMPSEISQAEKNNYHM